MPEGHIVAAEAVQTGTIEFHDGTPEFHPDGMDVKSGYTCQECGLTFEDKDEAKAHSEGDY